MYLIFLTLFVSSVSATDLDLSQDILQNILDIYNNVSLTSLSTCDDVTEDNVQFLMYTANNRDTPVRITAANYGALDLTLPVKMILHGWIQDGTKPWIMDFKNSYLAKGNYVVISVDWSSYSVLNYVLARCYVPKVGKVVASFILKSGLDTNKVHMIGFSLGAQVAGIAGKNVQISNNGEKIGRITGLDAAGPLFYPCDDSEHLIQSDATFVDGIHTNAWQFGYPVNYGTADFYPNCGLFQIGCEVIKINSTLSMEQNVLNNMFCSHIRSFEYFLESINSDKFLATPCSKCAWFTTGFCNYLYPQNTIMGDGCPTSAKGTYYLDTKSTSPYASR